MFDIYPDYSGYNLDTYESDYQEAFFQNDCRRSGTAYNNPVEQGLGGLTVPNSNAQSGSDDSPF